MYRIGRIEAAVASRLGVIDEKVQQILDGKAAPCALHAAQLELHARQIDALFRRVNSEPMHHGDGMRPATEGGA
ncbi:MAG: hypothetical protein PHU85_18950 [Phycisphaerae bacterium]|nr:hypothetical protein [Phycisphaerae bacterium]